LTYSGQTGPEMKKFIAMYKDIASSGDLSPELKH
jgi:hypothetical protein